MGQFLSLAVMKCIGELSQKCQRHQNTRGTHHLSTQSPSRQVAKKQGTQSPSHEVAKKKGPQSQSFCVEL